MAAKPEILTYDKTTLAASGFVVFDNERQVINGEATDLLTITCVNTEASSYNLLGVPLNPYDFDAAHSIAADISTSTHNDDSVQITDATQFKLGQAMNIKTPNKTQIHILSDQGSLLTQAVTRYALAARSENSNNVLRHIMFCYDYVLPTFDMTNINLNPANVTVVDAAHMCNLETLWHIAFVEHFIIYNTPSGTYHINMPVTQREALVVNNIESIYRPVFYHTPFPASPLHSHNITSELCTLFEKFARRLAGTKHDDIHMMFKKILADAGSNTWSSYPRFSTTNKKIIKRICDLFGNMARTSMTPPPSEENISRLVDFLTYIMSASDGEMLFVHAAPWRSYALRTAVVIWTIPAAIFDPNDMYVNHEVKHIFHPTTLLDKIPCKSLIASREDIPMTKEEGDDTPNVYELDKTIPQYDDFADFGILDDVYIITNNFDRSYANPEEHDVLTYYKTVAPLAAAIRAGSNPEHGFLNLNASLQVLLDGGTGSTTPISNLAAHVAAASPISAANIDPIVYAINSECKYYELVPTLQRQNNHDITNRLLNRKLILSISGRTEQQINECFIKGHLDKYMQEIVYRPLRTFNSLTLFNTAKEIELDMANKQAFYEKVLGIDLAASAPFKQFVNSLKPLGKITEGNIDALCELLLGDYKVIMDMTEMPLGTSQYVIDTDWTIFGGDKVVDRDATNGLDNANYMNFVDSVVATYHDTFGSFGTTAADFAHIKNYSFYVPSGPVTDGLKRETATKGNTDITILSDDARFTNNAKTIYTAITEQRPKYQDPGGADIYSGLASLFMVKQMHVAYNNDDVDQYFSTTTYTGDIPLDPHNTRHPLPYNYTMLTQRIDANYDTIVTKNDKTGASSLFLDVVLPNAAPRAPPPPRSEPYQDELGELFRGGGSTDDLRSYHNVVMPRLRALSEPTRPSQQHVKELILLLLLTADEKVLDTKYINELKQYKKSRTETHKDYMIRLNATYKKLYTNAYASSLIINTSTNPSIIEKNIPSKQDKKRIHSKLQILNNSRIALQNLVKPTYAPGTNTFREVDITTWSYQTQYQHTNPYYTAKQINPWQNIKPTAIIQAAAMYLRSEPAKEATKPDFNTYTGSDKDELIKLAKEATFLESTTRQTYITSRSVEVLEHLFNNKKLTAPEPEFKKKFVAWLKFNEERNAKRNKKMIDFYMNNQIANNIRVNGPMYFGMDDDDLDDIVSPVCPRFVEITAPIAQTNYFCPGEINGMRRLLPGYVVNKRVPLDQYADFTVKLPSGDNLTVIGIVANGVKEPPGFGLHVETYGPLDDNALFWLANDETVVYINCIMDQLLNIDINPGMTVDAIRPIAVAMTCIMNILQFITSQIVTKPNFHPHLLAHYHKQLNDVPAKAVLLLGKIDKIITTPSGTLSVENYMYHVCAYPS